MSIVKKLGMAAGLSLSVFSALSQQLPPGLGTAQTQPTWPAAAVGTPATTFGAMPQMQLGQGTALFPRANPQGTDAQWESEAPVAAPLARQLAVREQPSQFQQFVQASTGRLLPVFGAQFFKSPQSYAQATSAAAPASYVVSVGDEVQVNIWGSFDFSTRLVVDRNGQVQIPKVGVVTVAGVRADQLSSVFKAQLSKVFSQVEVSAAVSRLRSIQVYVVGQALKPGTHTVSSLSTLVNALFASGGPNPNGSLRNIELRRGNQVLAKLDLYTFLGQGDRAGDVSLQSGDVIVIPPAGPRVAIAGAYDHAAIYELKGNTSVQQLLALGGGMPALATSQKALIERIQPQANPPRQVLDLALDPKGLSTPLQDGDILTLVGISQGFANAVTLKGNVAHPMRQAWRPGMRVLDLIPDPQALITQDYFKKQNRLVQVVPLVNADDAANVGKLQAEQLMDPAAVQASGTQLGVPRQRESVEEAVKKFKAGFDAINWDYAVIERLNPQTLTNQLIPFNLGKAVLGKDPAQNLELQAGDVVTVFSQSDIRLPAEKQLRLVRVEGEVAAPGIYPALPGETMPQLLRRIGGFTPYAYVYGTEFTRESVRKQQQQNLEQLVSRLESSLSSQSNSQLANLGADQAARANVLLEAQKQNQKQQLERLRALRSNGRVALELPPERAELAAIPPLPLEDGDTIVVPSLPSFVSAYGAVNNQNAIVYKPGRTVADLVRLAGLTEDADEDQAFVLRADGTVVARKTARSGWLGGGFDNLALMPGDTLVVPPKVDRETFWTVFMRNAKDITQILSNLGLGVAALRSL